MSFNDDQVEQAYTLLTTQSFESQTNLLAEIRKLGDSITEDEALAICYVVKGLIEKRIVEPPLEDKPPVKERGRWGDKNPCQICGNYGYGTIHNSHIDLCRKHYNWYYAEYRKFNQEEK